LNLKEIMIQEEDICKEYTKPTLRQSVERCCLKAQLSARSLCRRKLVPILNAHEDEHKC